jgi:hypothetical protein
LFFFCHDSVAGILPFNLSKGEHIMAGSKVPKNETPEARFKRMAVTRVNKCIKSISLLGNLAGSRYKSTPEQITKMETAFREVLVQAFGRLRGQKASKESFTL